MKTENKISAHIDWLLLTLYASLVLFGWFNLYAVSYDQSLQQSLFDLSRNTGKQFLWIATSGIILVITLFFDTKFYQSLAYIFYFFTLLLLVCALLFGVSVGGHKAWLQWRGIQFQPAEFAKLACAMAIAKYLEDDRHAKLTQHKTQFRLFCIVSLPAALILLQGDLGSSLVFVAFVIVFYREGLSPWLLLTGLYIVTISLLTLLISHSYLVIGTLSLALLVIGLGKRSIRKILLVSLIALGNLAFIEGVHLFVGKVLKPHQQNRIKALLNPNADPLGIGWNVTQSKIAIGSGGLWGKGFLRGTQTKYGFVPEQSTDFIFCTIGEEHGWVGASLVILAFSVLISRVLYVAERQRLRFARVYGYAVASILFFHFMVNIGMTIGLVPVIGIPLPFISYGGSSLWSFSLMLFVLMKFDAERKNYISWRQAL